MQSYGSDEILLMGWLMQFALNVTENFLANFSMKQKYLLENVFLKPMFSETHIKLA